MRSLFSGLLIIGIVGTALEAQDKADPKKDPSVEIADPDSPMNLGKLAPIVQGRGHQTPIAGLFFTSDSKRLVSVESSRTVCVWDVATGERLQVMYFPGYVRILAAALSPDDKSLAVYVRLPVKQDASEAHLRVMNLETGSIRAIPSRLIGENAGLAFDRGGNRLLVMGGRDGIDWYGNMRSLFEKPASETLTIKPFHTTSVADAGTAPFRASFGPPKGRLAFVGRRSPGPGGYDGPQLAGLAPMQTLKATDPAKATTLDDKLIHPFAVAWNRNGNQVAIGYENGLKVFDENGKLLREFGKDKFGPFCRNPQVKTAQIHQLHFLNPAEIVICWKAFIGDSDQAVIGMSIVHQQDPAKTVDLNNQTARFAPFPMAGTAPNGKWSAYSHGPDNASFTVVNHDQRAVHFQVNSENDAPSEVAWSKDGSTLLWNSNRDADKRVPFQGVNWKKMEYVRRGDIARLDSTGKYKIAEKKLRESYLWHETGNSVFEAVPKTLSKAKSDRIEIDLVKGKETIPLLIKGAAQPIAAFTVSADPAKHPWALVARKGLSLYDDKGKQITEFFFPHLGAQCVTSSPDGRFFICATIQGLLTVYNVDRQSKLLIHVSGSEWVIWAPNGYYAASPNGDRLFGWLKDEGADRAARFIPAAQLRDRLHRPDIIQSVLQQGSMAVALRETKAVAVELEKNLPPQVALQVTPKEGGVFEVEATARTTAGSNQKVSQLHLLLDGRPVATSPGTFAVQKFSPPVAETAQPVRWTLKLDPGTSGKLTARVHSTESYAISNEFTIDVPAPPTIRKKGSLYYFGVGISEYAADKGKTNPQWKLDWSQKDVNDLSAAFKNDIVPKSRHQNYVPITLTNEQATKQAILAKLDELKGLLKPADLLVVHFSCHGEKEPTEGGLYLLPYDWNPDDLKGTGVAGDRMQECFSAYPCPVLLMLDACHSGAMKSPSEELLRRLSDERTGVTVMTAALSFQKAEERKDLKNGVFTAGLLEGMRSAEAVDPFNKRQYAHNLYAHAFGFVNRETNGKQMPSFSQSGAVPPIVLREGN